jgi:hypothetical protein
MAGATIFAICRTAVIKNSAFFFFLLNFAYFVSKICYNIIITIIPLYRRIIHIVCVPRALLHGCGTLVYAERLDWPASFAEEEVAAPARRLLELKEKLYISLQSSSHCVSKVSITKFIRKFSPEQATKTQRAVDV